MSLTHCYFRQFNLDHPKTASSWPHHLLVLIEQKVLKCDNKEKETNDERLSAGSCETCCETDGTEKLCIGRPDDLDDGSNTQNTQRTTTSH